MPKTPATAPDLFHATGAELRTMAEAGDAAAVAEIARRKDNRAAKNAARVATAPAAA